MDGRPPQAQPATGGTRASPIVSRVLSDGRLVELLYDEAERSTRFAIWTGAGWDYAASITGEGSEGLVPYSPTNSLLKNHIVLFPSEPIEYGEAGDLVDELCRYLHRYVDLSESFERLAAYYALLSWVHDRFNELPYLRLRGDYGTGKTRFLLTLGSICYKPIFASGASTVSPLFHMLDRFGGTLVIDEADFRFSDEKSDLVKILNNGNVRGFPVLRAESRDGREFNPRAFHVFGPKILAMRHHFEDPALESRFITETSGARSLRSDIPINLPAEQREEALQLRNKLLLFRFRTHSHVTPLPGPLDPGLEARLNQIYAPLAAVIPDAEARDALRAVAQANSARLKAVRGATMQGQVLTVIRNLMETSPTSNISIKELNLVTHKSHGNFVIPLSETPKLHALFTRYGITSQDTRVLVAPHSATTALPQTGPADLGDCGDVAAAPSPVTHAQPPSERACPHPGESPQSPRPQDDTANPSKNVPLGHKTESSYNDESPRVCAGAGS